MVKEDVSNLVTMPSNCEVSKRALCVGLLWCWKWVCTRFFFTMVGTPPVSRPVRWGNNRPGSFQRDTAGRKTSLSSAILSCGSRLLLVPPACWNTLRLKIQLNVKQRKSCNYPFTDFLFQIFISEVISQRASTLFLRKMSCSVYYPG